MWFNIIKADETFEEHIKRLMSIREKQDVATKKSLELLNGVISRNDKVTIVKEPEFQYGNIYGAVKIEGESGNIYHYNFEHDPEVENGAIK